MNEVNLRTADGLKKACLELETRSSDVNRTWRDELRQFLTEVRDASVEERATRKFQERLWEDNPISATGMGTVHVERAVEDEGFRKWLAQASVRGIPGGALARTDALTQLFDEARERLQPLCDRMPQLKLLRILAAFFPRDLTTIASIDPLRQLRLRMFGSGKLHPVAGHIKVRHRLDEVLGPVDPENMDAVVARLTLPWRLYELSGPAEPDETVVIVGPGDERLKPLPAARRRRGLTAIKGSFQEMLSILEFVRDSPTRDELIDYLRASNPKSKDSSLKMILNILKSEFGVVRHQGERYVLTERGEAVLGPDFRYDCGTVSPGPGAAP